MQLSFDHWQVNGPQYRRSDVCVADLNGDGVPDLLSVHDFDPGFAANVIIRPGTGASPDDPSFDDPFPIADQVYFGVGDSLLGVAAGDVDGDGHVDLVFSNGGYGADGIGAFDDTPDTISVLLGNGDFTFQQEAQYTVGGSRARDVQLADVDADGDLDAVVAESNTASVSVLMNNGAGVFTLAQSLANTGGGDTYAIEFADLDRDGDLDFVTRGEDALVLFENNGSGVFVSAGVLIASAVNNRAFEGIDTGDFNRDGLVDLVAGSPSGDSVTVLLSSGSGPMLPFTLAHGGNPPSLSTDTNDVVVGDFNGDRRLDIALSAGKYVWIIRGNGDGTFQPAVLPDRFDLNDVFGTFDDAIQLFCADFDGDGSDDIVVHQRGDQYEWVVMYNRCDAAPPIDRIRRRTFRPLRP